MKRFFLGFLSVFLLGAFGQAEAQVTVGNTATFTGTSSTPVAISWSHNNNGSTNDVLIVSCNMQENFGADVTGITYNGVSMTEAVGETRSAPGSESRIFYLVAPAAGSNTVAVTNPSTGQPRFIGCASYTLDNVDQSNPVGSTNTNSLNVNQPSLTVTGVTSGSIVIDGYTHQNDALLSVGAGQTLVLSHGPFSSMQYGSSHEASSGSVVMNWTGGISQRWGQVASEFVEPIPVSGASNYWIE